mmetsp:Transcript_20249/g.51134  ORF Transcript_20249/g.51134 Transcript_20249/m.51134 type:complete len:373 (+) Transcript_20249:679-1797(+)|eukprot:CAMPEP_0178992146 /NCGR_PEP_ID=MMETSP0795-20121207/5940_1 /TAXON_ID=88552 /ORGANISM="Amoebophrya sp., Strain Ameob2" /LENGTH=372 /DNA_ID=CAMNT_0020683971 /DNA_START=858 /DNA_END=1976 /DNA_ORIENTATION=+
MPSLNNLIEKFSTTAQELDDSQLPSEFRKGDDTFQRVYGHRVYDKQERSSAETGKFWREGNVDQHALDNFSSAGPRETYHAHKAVEFAEQYVNEVEAVESSRCVFAFPTTTTQDDVPRVEATKPTAPGDFRTRTDVKTQIKYTNDVPITFYSEQLKSDKAYVRSSLKASAATGHHCFGKNASFSTPCSLSFATGPHKVHEDNKLLQLAENNRSRLGDPLPSELKTLPCSSLVELKTDLVEKLKEKEGPFCLAKLRARLAAAADGDHFVSCEKVVEVLSSINADVKLSHLLNALRINADVNYFSLLQSLRPSIRKAGEREAFIEATVSKSWRALFAGVEGIATAEDARTYAYDVASCCKDLADFKNAIGAADA